VHLIDVLSLRPVPGAALFLALTRRCPLRCAHCSTESLLTSEQHPAEPFVRFVETFRPDDRPEVIVMSGGEPFLRPRLVQTLAERACEAGCRSHVLSGMFFARGGHRIPPAIRRAIDTVDHFSASLDVFHEREVSRADVFRALAELLEAGKDVSLQTVGLGPDVPYLADVTADVRRTFDDRVPVLVGQVGATGRAREWLPDEDEQPGGADADPCTVAAWPVVGFDGTIVACCNQRIVDGPAPGHLRLGHAATDDWPTVRRRLLGSPLLRAIRTFGPEYVARRFARGVACSGYCSTCTRLGEDPELEARLAAEFERPALQLVEQQVTAVQRAAGALAFARRFGVARYAELVTLGAPEEAIPSAA
jgi:pyruvate-formate lyase-activating enzyme